MLKELSSKQIKLIIVFSLFLLIALFFLLDGQQWLHLGHIKANKDALLTYADEHFFLFLITTVLLYILSTTLSLPGATVLSLAVGFVFGRWLGTFLVVFSATIGSAAVFLLARYLFAEQARKKLLQNPQAVKLLEGFQENAFNYLLFLRLVPFFPFWLVNLAPAFTSVSLKVFVLTTGIGIIPGSFVYANLGRSLGEINSLNDLLSLPVLLAFCLLGILAIAPILYERYKVLQKSNHET